MHKLTDPVAGLFGAYAPTELVKAGVAGPAEEEPEGAAFPTVARGLGREGLEEEGLSEALQLGQSC